MARGDRDHARAGARGGRKPCRKEVRHLAPAFADHRDDDAVGRRRARDHAHEDRFPHPASRDQADPLTTAECRQRVDRAHAGVEGDAHRLAVERRSVGRARDRGERIAAYRTQIVKRRSDAVDDAAGQRLADAYERAARRGGDARAKA